MLTELPVLLVNEEMKRKLARKQIQTAINDIRNLGSTAGMSDRSLFEFSSLAKFIELEISKQKV